MLRRRSLLKGALAAPLVIPTGCDALVSLAARRVGDDIPTRIEAPDSPQIDPVHHLLDRVAFGPWPGDVESVRRLGPEAWLDAQLDPSAIDDTGCRLRTAWIDTVRLPRSLAFEFRPEEVESQLVSYTLLQATYSRRQLHEVMVRFWSDHFNIAIGKSLCRHLKPSHDQDVLRPLALGRFRELLEASAMSPAMLVYLDGRDNKVEGPGDRPNENYARELFELHGLGVHGGYSQRDVMEAARCLSGWTVREKWAPGEVEFDPTRHDDGDKRVLGQTIPGGGGKADVRRLFDLVADHPSCARFIATKLCRFLIDDRPPMGAIEAAAETFGHTGGQIADVVRTIVRSPDFAASAGLKVKRPFRYVVSCLRALGAQTHAREGFHEALGRMGQPLFGHPTPDGYPQTSTPWLGTLMWRWNFALGLVAGEIAGCEVDVPRLTDALGASGDRGVHAMARHLFGRRPTFAEVEALSGYLAERGDEASPTNPVALLLCSPRFQRH